MLNSGQEWKVPFGRGQRKSASPRKGTRRAPHCRPRLHRSLSGRVPPLLEGVKKQLGSVPNLFRTVGVSPAALQGYLGLNGALAKGRLNAATRERIAITVAEIDGCSYCLAAHSYIAKNLVKLDDREIAASRDAASADPKVAAALRFAAKVVEARGHVERYRCRRGQGRRL